MTLFLDIMFYIFTGLYLYTSAVVIMVVLLANRNPVKTLSWIMLLIMVPIFGVIIYLMLGQDFRRRKIISRNSIREISKSDHSCPMKQWVNHDFTTDQLKLMRLLYNNSQAYLYENTKVDVFTDGASAFESMFEALEAAKDHIHIEFYIIENDEVGNRMRELLIRKSLSGVRIRVIYDYLGGLKLKHVFLNSMRDSGIFIQPFLPADSMLGFSRINYRNHRKVVVIDGKVGFTGGMNIADRYVKGNNLGLWRDTFVRLEGSGVFGLQNCFLIDWNFVDNKIITDSKYYPKPNNFRNNHLQIVTSGPDTDWETIMQGIVMAVSNATKYVYIHTPYFLPPESLITTLQSAALSGIDVCLMMPERSDSRLTHAASRSYVQGLLESGIRVFFYRHNFLHSKAIVIDDELAIVGTANMDVRSYEQNFEISAFIYDKKTALALKRSFRNDMKSCKLLNLNLWKSRKRMEKFKESVARLFSPML